MKTLTVFTPSYNRAHTLPRTYESLCRQTCDDFEWLVVDDGSKDNTRELVDCWIKENKIPIRYIYKENGGLYTGYNTAYTNIETELNVCIDSDDYMPENGVELIVNTWREKGSKKYAGIMGLDFDVRTSDPIGGYFPGSLKETYLLDLYTKKIHIGDTKQAMRTDLMKKVAPQTGFPGEKNFNPVYMLLQVDNEYPLLVINENLCWVEYQIGADSMSQGIFKQYVNSPRSFAKLRLLEMTLKRNNLKNKFRSAVHYISSCMIAKDKNWFKQSTNKPLTLLAIPLGILLYFYIKFKTRS